MYRVKIMEKKVKIMEKKAVSVRLKTLFYRHLHDRFRELQQEGDIKEID